MAKYRNITGEDRWVQLPSRLVKVPAGGIFDAEDCTYYFQTGDTGEQALFQLVGKPSKGSPAPTAAADSEGEK